jgi:hypothetical protein
VGCDDGAAVDPDADAALGVLAAGAVVLPAELAGAPDIELA